MVYKSGFVAILGRPNVGKSTLLNQILHQKVAIISDKVQTTRRRIRGIFTDENSQIIFVDTPGIHKPLHELGKFLLEEVKLSIPDADILIFMVDGTEPPGHGDKWIIQNVLSLDKPIIMVVNKVDLVKNLKKRKEIVDKYKELFQDKEVTTLQISAKTGRNIDDLMKNLFRTLPEGPKYYPDDDVTDQSIRAISEEIVREKVLHLTSDEIPHSVAVVITDFKQSEKLTSILATVYVERDSQKGIIIGKKAEMLKKIGIAARQEIEEMIEQQVYLELHVKVKKNWRKNQSALRQFGYKSKK